MEPQSDDANAQLSSELRDSIIRDLRPLRPILTHLNADTSWLLSVPIPTASQPKQHSAARKSKTRRSASLDRQDDASRRSYFHILIDPWLKGPQADVSRFLSQQWHKEESALQSIDEVLDVVAELEALASHSTVNDSDKRTQRKLDLVVVSHEFTDHMHRETLLEVNPSVPVIATVVAAGKIKSWKHFSTVIEMPRFSGEGKDWKQFSHAALPDWLAVARLDSSASDLLNYHSAVLVTFDSEAGKSGPEAVIYTPHGITAEQLAPVATSDPQISTLALIHTMHDITLSGAQLNLGAHNGLKAQRLTHAKYWIGTHDEVKTGYGFVSWILRRKVISLEDALRLEIEQNAGDNVSRELDALDKVEFVDLKNGNSLQLK